MYTLHLLNFNSTAHCKKLTFFLTPRIDLVTQNIMFPKYLIHITHIFIYNFFRTVNTFNADEYTYSSHTLFLCHTLHTSYDIY